MTRRLVIDASILAKIYLRDEEFGEIASAIIQRYARGTIDLFAPQIVLYEIPSAIQGAVRRRRLNPQDAEQAIEHFLALGIPTIGEPSTLPSMIKAAYQFAERLGCRVYDALYVIVADALQASLITADRKLFNATRGHLDYVVWIEHYAEQVAAEHEG